MESIMSTMNLLKTLLASAILIAASSSFGHVVLAEPTAQANASYRATFRVGHGCDGSPITSIKVTIPAGFQGSKPMPKAGWVLSTKVEKLAKPYTSYGKEVTQDVTEISWTAASKDYWLQDAHYDEFVLRGTTQGAVGPIWFAVLQTCEAGSVNWADVPATGTSTKGMKTPAALLEVVKSEGPAHQH
jgi:periplasmic copper chaperone A